MDPQYRKILELRRPLSQRSFKQSGDLSRSILVRLIRLRLYQKHAAKLASCRLFDDLDRIGYQHRSIQQPVAFFCRVIACLIIACLILTP